MASAAQLQASGPATSCRCSGSCSARSFSYFHLHDPGARRRPRPPPRSRSATTRSRPASSGSCCSRSRARPALRRHLHLLRGHDRRFCEQISRTITFSVRRPALAARGLGLGLTVALTGQDGFWSDQARGFQRHLGFPVRRWHRPAPTRTARSARARSEGDGRHRSDRRPAVRRSSTTRSARSCLQDVTIP